MSVPEAGDVAIRLWGALRLAALGLILASGAVRVAAAEETEGRVVAVGDVHGDFESFVAILRQAELIDEDLRWTGGETTLVQTGDFLDRGPGDVEVMNLFRSLQSQASKSGGKVVVLLGNHEILNLQRDFRYVSDESFAAFADKKSERRRQEAFQDYVRWLKKKAKLNKTAEPVIDESFRENWMAQHPPGLLERIQALGGDYGKWLRGLPAVVKLEDTIFLHAGIHPDLASLSLDDINRRAKGELAAFDDTVDSLTRRGVVLPFFTLPEIHAAVGEELSRVRRMLPPEDAAPGNSATRRLADYANLLESLLSPNQLTSHPDGPFWFRGYADWGEEGEAQLDMLLETYQAKRFVVGHSTVLSGGIQERFGGKAFLIDTGMLSDFYPGGRASALEIQRGKVHQIYLTPAEEREPAQGSSR